MATFTDKLPPSAGPVLPSSANIHLQSGSSPSAANTIGVILPKTAINVSGNSPNPPVQPETPKEESWWSKASPWVHGGLGLISFVPGLSVISGAADGAIYAAEGDYVEAGLAVATMIPGGKVVTTAGKAVSKVVKIAGKAEKVAEEAAKLKKTADEAAKLKKMEEEARRLKKLEEEAAAAKKVEPPKKKPEPEKKAESNGGGHSKGGPCDHLRQGNGKGPYRGGAHSKTSQPTNDQKDSHHMPADDASPLKKKDGPAIQMDPLDHAKTSSNGQMPNSIGYREMLSDLIADGKWREAMTIEIRDIRRIEKLKNSSGKYREAMLEMLEYFKCLQKNNLLR